MAIFIKGVGNISPQQTYDGQFLDQIKEHNGLYLLSVEPDYKSFISPTMIRRMGRILKMGVASATICLQDAKVEMPDAIISGTGLGCIVDTDKFLTAIIENGEQFLTPTSFIQSTHNTISAQIALMIKCLGYNYTYVHRGFSFESSVHDAVMMLMEGEAKNVLVGGVDEMTETYYAITKRLAFWKPDVTNHLSLIQSNTRGAIPGEGAAYFVLSQEENLDNYAELKDTSTLYKPQSFEEVEQYLNKTLERNNLSKEDIDLVIYGISGDFKSDKVYHYLSEGLFKNINSAYFKHLSGEYPTSVSFGLWLGAKALKHQSVPPIVRLKTQNEKEIRNVLIYNHYRDLNHSSFLLKKI
jgi:3-oxoacyl-[acyl-carrier-protein] synthase II